MSIFKKNMKINNIHNLSFSAPEKQQNTESKAKQTVPKNIDTDALTCQGTYNTVMVKTKPSTNNLMPNAIEFCKSIKKPNENIGREYLQHANGEFIARIKLGTPVEGWKDLYDYKTSIACYFDKDGNVNKAFKYNEITKEIDVYDANGEQTHHFTKEERDALYYYKYHPDSIHSELRKGKNHWQGKFLEETLSSISQLEKLFSDDSKIFRTTEGKVVYRGLQSNLSEEQKNTLSRIGGIYTDTSFCSTTEDLEVAKRFAHGNPILKISLPKNTKYMDVDRLFNVDRLHWSEQELLLDKNSSFVVTGYDPENNIIEVDYLQ